MKKYSEKHVTFLSAIFIGFIVHSFMLLNKISWHDDIGIVTLGATVTSGRWGVQLFADIYKFFIGDVISLTLVEGILFFILIGWSGVLVGQMLKIKSFAGSIILGGMMVIFPVVTSMFGYMFYMVWYAFGIFFAVLAVYLLEHIRVKIFGLLASIMCICFSLSMYQAFLSVTVSLMLLVMGEMMVESQSRSIKEILYKGIRYVTAIVLGLISYIYIAKWYVRQYGQELSNYRNIDQMGKLKINQLVSGARNAYHDFFFLTKNAADCLFMDNMLYVYYIVLIILIYFIIRKFIYIYAKNKIYALLYLIICCLFPLSVNLVYIYGAGGGVSAIMKYSQVMVFIALIYLCENTLELSENKKVSIILKKFSIGILFFSMFFYARFANKCYLKADLQQSETISWFNTLITQIKSVEGYDDEYKIAYINKGNIDDKSAFQATPIRDINIVPYSSEYLYNNYAFIEYMKVWCGFNQAEVDDYLIYENNMQIQQMPSYPKGGSIKVIDNVIVVKF